MMFDVISPADVGVKDIFNLDPFVIFIDIMSNRIFSILFKFPIQG